MLDLRSAANTLHERFGSSVEEAYVPGKTAFRDAICERYGLSEAESEMIGDSLERAGAIRFSTSPEVGPVWTIDPTCAPAP
jgi:hypothetical protein